MCACVYESFFSYEIVVEKEKNPHKNKVEVCMALIWLNKF